MRPPPRTAWEHATLGRAFLAPGDLSQARRELAAAVRLDPAGRWPNFYYGLCAYRTGRHADAVAAFSVCIGTAPGVAGCFYNRALAHAALNRPEHALQDYDRALELDPTHAAAALNRGCSTSGGSDSTRPRRISAPRWSTAPTQRRSTTTGPWSARPPTTLRAH